VSTELNDILPEDVEAKVKEAAEVSMGTEISDEDLTNIIHLCDQVGLFDCSLVFQPEN
jgi:nucleolar protein 58